MILVDTREQRPLWDFKKDGVDKIKLDEGDYTTDKLYNIAHAERKSAMDLYGSIIQGHKRFRAEIIRANEKGLKFAVFVECSEKMFYAKKFKGAGRLKTPSKVLKKIWTTMQEKYEIEVIWCIGRTDMKKKILEWFEEVTE